MVHILHDVILVVKKRSKVLLSGVLSGWSGLVVDCRGEGTGEGQKIVSLDCY